MNDTATVLYHNPACGTSRRTLALMRRAGIEPRIVDYLRDPPSRAELARLADDVDGGVRALLRTKEPLYAALGLDDPGCGTDALLDRLAQHPALLNRPIVRTSAGVRVCRPAERVGELLAPATGAIAIRAAAWPDDADRVRALFRAYADGLGIDLAFQGFEAELGGLPGRYAPPGGAVLVAERDAVAVGCIAMRPLAATTCEMKRLYVDASARSTGLGRRLAVAIGQAARDAGYTRIHLDTLPDMRSARRLYASLGFEPVAPYAFNPVPDAVFLGLELGNPRSVG